MEKPNSQPDISILIPACNKEKTILRSLHSALEQTGTNVEVIVADDASSDRTGELVRALAEKDSRVRLVTHRENRGTLITRMDAFKASAGKYILCLDADDTLDAGTAKLVLAAAEKEQADLVGFGARLHRGKACAGTVDAVKCTLTGRDIFDAAFRDHLYNWSVCLKLIRRDLFAKAVSETEAFYCISAEDFYFYTVLSLFAKRLIMTGRVLYNYWIEEGLTGECSSESFGRFATMLDALKAVRRFLEKQGMMESCRLDFETREREHFYLLLKRFPGTAAALTIMMEKYEPAVIRKYLSEYYSPEYAGQAMTAWENHTGLPPLPNRRINDERGRIKRLVESVIPPENGLWFLLKRGADWFRWRKYR